MLKKMIAIIIILIAGFGFFDYYSNKTTRYEAEFLLLFDTQTKIVGYSKSKEEFTGYSQLIYDTLKEYHELFDIYNDYEGINNIKTINDNAGIAPVKVDKRIIDLLSFSKSAYENTYGKMNIAYGAVLRIWHDYREEGIDNPENAKLPPIDLLQKAAQHTNFDQVIINEEESTVYLADQEMSLDVGAVAKGYAVEKVSQIAMENGFTSGLISVGGNVRTIGTKGKSDELWNVGIQNPDLKSENQNLKVVYLTDLSLVTSGVYQRYYTVDDKRYHHIIDPETYMPSEYFEAVTIICQDSGMADVLSTAVFNMPYEQGKDYVEGLKDTEAVWVFKSGEMKYSSGFEKYIINIKKISKNK